MCLSVSQKYWTALSSISRESVEGYISLTDPHLLQSLTDFHSCVRFMILNLFLFVAADAVPVQKDGDQVKYFSSFSERFNHFFLTSSVLILLKRYCAWIQTHFVLVSAFLVHLCVCLLKSVRGGKKRKRSCYSCRSDSCCQMLSKVYLNRIKNICIIVFYCIIIVLCNKCTQCTLRGQLTSWPKHSKPR